jgi:LDH2 family malate/lactate/ureidoglycolate dehydrogenase
MAGHKGYAIAAMVDILSGVLSGSSFLSGVNGPYKPDLKSGAGHFFIAIDIAKLQPLAEFNDRMERFIDELKSTPRAKEVEEIFYPGEMEARSDVRLRREGIDLPEDTIADLRRITSETGVGWTL